MYTFKYTKELSLSEPKEQARHIVKRFAGKPKTILSLSADNFLFESQFPKAKIVCCEMNPSVYIKGLANKPANVTYLNKNILDIEPNYEFIWLDFCSNLKPLLINELIAYFQKAQKYDAKTISITLYLKQEKELPKYLHLYGAESLDDMRFNVFPKLISQYTDYNLVDIYKYLSDNHSPMGVFTFKLNQN